MICVSCGETILSSELEKIKGKSYHKVCAVAVKEQLKKAAIMKDQKKVEKQKREAEPTPEMEGLSSDKLKVEQYLARKLNAIKITSLTSYQLTSIKDKTKLSWEQILLTLRYLAEIIPNHQNFSQRSLGAIPYYAEEAEEFWNGVEAANAFNEARSLQNHVTVLPYHSKPTHISLSCNIEDL